MKRRDSLKYIVLGSAAATFSLQSCKDEVVKVSENQIPESEMEDYGRTPKEKAIDQKLMAEEFFNAHEKETLGVLCALILPANDEFGSATDVGAPDFIEFMAKDYPPFQTPLRGGLMWLDHKSNKDFNKEFKTLSEAQQKSILDQIAFEDDEYDAPDLKQGKRFFKLIRNLTLTGYFTSETGIKDIGYKGNTPNVWDGVPQEVLGAHGVAYEKEWLDKCVDQSKRGEIAEWDDEGNLLT